MKARHRYSFDQGIKLPEPPAGIAPVTIMNARGRVVAVVPAAEFTRGFVPCVRHGRRQCGACRPLVPRQIARRRQQIEADVRRERSREK